MSNASSNGDDICRKRPIDLTCSGSLPISTAIATTKRKMTTKTTTDDDHVTASTNDTSASTPDATADIVDVMLNHCSKLRFEAIFHPKFDNENVHEKMIRKRMKDKVSSVLGYLEVSIKHSGSLLLWSGSDRYYSKNSLNNQYTHCGEILLRQHFIRSYWNTDGLLDDTLCVSANTIPAGNNEIDFNQFKETIERGERMYKECSDYIELNRLTLSFEVVTSVLGDHGDKPKRDFLILTAVADRNTSTFYTTIQIIQLAHKFRLPHNDVWIYALESSVDSLFVFYDTYREIGKSDSTIENLNQSSDLSIPSMYPHTDFQGNIMEGIVIRYVATADNGSATYPNQDKDAIESKELLNQLSLLSMKSKELCRAVPPSLPECYDLVRSVASVGDWSPVLTSNLRRLSPDLQIDNLQQLSGPVVPLNGNKNENTTENKLVKVMERDQVVRGCSSRRCITLKPSHTGSIHWIPKLMTKLLHSTDDLETKNIANIIHNLSNISDKVSYSCYRESYTTATRELGDYDKSSSGPCIDEKHSSTTAKTSRNGDNCRYICIVHVRQDATFFKYHKRMRKDDLPLFRGFSFEMIVGAKEEDASTSRSDVDNQQQLQSVNIIVADSLTNSNIEEENDKAEVQPDVTLDDEQPNAPLMLKMKFLPYMVRTFGCRNGLSIIQKDGISSFMLYSNNLFTKWGMSVSARNKWIPFFQGWAEYARNCFQNNGLPSLTTPGVNVPKDLQPLSSFHYLDHLDFFNHLYESNYLYRSNDASSDENTFQGLVVVVAIRQNMADIISDYIAANVGCKNRISDSSEITKDLMLLSLRKGHGYVYSSTVENGCGKIRNLCKDYGDFISLVLFGCSDDEVQKHVGENSGQDEIQGKLKAWRKTRCAALFDLPRSSLLIDEDISSETSNEFRPTDSFKELLKSLKVEKFSDDRAGLLVFFPTFPGCGKSALCSGSENIGEIIEAIREKIEGDEKRCRRNLLVQVGDETKGKFWPFVRRSRAKDTSCVLIADKNAPTNVWELIGEICASTKAFAVPVIPDGVALQTTRIQGIRKPDGSIAVDDDKSHSYPFSLSYLALCMARVLDRPPGSHGGKLDDAVNDACLIVINFFSMYRGMLAEGYVDSISASLAGGGGLMCAAPIVVPTFRDGCCPQMPESLELLLTEALQYQYGLVVFKGLKAKTDQNSYPKELAERLRTCINDHKSFLLGMSEDLVVSRNVFFKSLSERIYHLGSTFTYEAPAKPFVKYASIDFQFKNVETILFRNKDDSRFADFFDAVAEDKLKFDELFKKYGNGISQEKTKFVVRPHLTLAHCSQMSQEALRSSFGPLCMSEVTVSVVGLLWSDTVAALAVRAPDATNAGSCIPMCRNTFPHLTVWCQHGSSARESNSLPIQVKGGKAHQVDFDAPVVIKGFISIWEDRKIQ